ncbi:MAG: TonB family protein [Sulfurimonas sp.]|jgi:protein TonB|uniref:TonB family protein n=1 Tax=Sulfurimonas sp. TaxID=2022749 RepID=UPI0035695B44
MSMADKNSIKSVFVSLVLHLFIAFTFFYVSSSKSIVEEEPPKLLSISLSSFELPVVQKPHESESEHVVQKQEVKKVMQKPIKSIEKKVEEIVQNRVVESASAVQETLIKDSTEHLQAKEAQSVAESKVEEKKSATNMESMEKEFAKINFQSIRDKVLANLKYPNTAKRMGIQGCVEVTLIIDSNGKLLDVILEKSSGHEVLDKSAIKAAGELYAQALPVPQIISRVTLPINFTLN